MADGNRHNHFVHTLLGDPKPEREDQKLKDPETGDEYNLRAAEAYRVQYSLKQGLLTHYPLVAVESGATREAQRSPWLQSAAPFGAVELGAGAHRRWEDGFSQEQPGKEDSRETWCENGFAHQAEPLLLRGRGQEQGDEPGDV